MAARKTVPERKATSLKGYKVLSQVEFMGTDDKPHRLDERPRHDPRLETNRVGGKDIVRSKLGPRKMKDGPDGEDGKPQRVPVTPEEDPVIIPLGLIREQDASEFEAQGALAPHYA